MINILYIQDIVSYKLLKVFELIALCAMTDKGTIFMCFTAEKLMNPIHSVILMVLETHFLHTLTI